jgi:hypothetical protein
MQCIDEIELDLKPDQAPILLGKFSEPMDKIL